MTKSSTTNIGRGALMTSIVIMALAVLAVCWAAISGKSLMYLIYALPYALVIGCSYAVLANKVKSETLKRIVTLLNIVGVASVFFFLWVYITFAQNYTF
jgi:predicted neutral ceramidase superfamily lipid hydrolase